MMQGCHGSLVSHPAGLKRKQMIQSTCCLPEFLLQGSYQMVLLNNAAHLHLLHATTGDDFGA